MCRLVYQVSTLCQSNQHAHSQKKSNQHAFSLYIFHLKVEKTKVKKNSLTKLKYKWQIFFKEL